jgi:metallo-beta-lactamase class B
MKIKSYLTLLLLVLPWLGCERIKTPKTLISDSATVENTTAGSARLDSNTMTPTMRDSLGKNPSLFLRLATKQLKWEEPTEPFHIVGPIYFVGTTGLSSFLITTTKGHILLYTGMSSSGPMIEQSIKKLGFKPSDIKVLLTGHAHVDHVGGHAYIKNISGAQVAIMDAEKELIESGGKVDFHYGAYQEYRFDPVQVDRVLHNGDKVIIGDVTMTALHTPGHTMGSTTWTMTAKDGVKKYNIVFPDGTSINPGYRITVNPSYPGIEANYRKTIAILETLKPDIWLSSHTDFFNLNDKLKFALISGAEAYIDPVGYTKRIADESSRLAAQLTSETLPKEQQ